MREGVRECESEGDARAMRERGRLIARRALELLPWATGLAREFSIAGAGCYVFVVSTRASSAATPADRVDLTPIRQLVARIVAAWRPEQIWLFGSQARGTATPSSDWDLLVVVPDSIQDADVDPVAAWRLVKASGIRADVVPCRAGDFRDDARTPNTLAYEASTRGMLVYER